MTQLTLAFVMNPLEGVNIDTDTSFAFMLAAQERGHSIVHLLPSGVELQGVGQASRVYLRGRRVAVQRQPGEHFQVLESVCLPATDCAAILIRTDPPFDQDYLTTSWLLSFAERQGVWVINSPAGLRAANEKLYALEFPELIPQTLISSHAPEIRRFVEQLGAEAIAKPIDGHGGFGVFRLRGDDTNFNAIIDVLTNEGRRHILVQEFLAEGLKGDKRLLFLDGELKGCLTRIPKAGDHRGNVHVGGTTVVAQMDDADHRIAKALGPRLKADGLFFAGVDTIAGKLIEVNITSPTLVQELFRLTNIDLAQALVEAIEARA